MASLNAFGVRPPRRERQTLIEQVCSIAPQKWPSPPDQQLDVLRALGLYESYTKRKLAVEYYVQNRRGDYIEKQTGISVTKAKRLFERCGTPARDGSIPGFYACLPTQRETVQPKHVRDPNVRPFDPELAEAGKGLKGIFQALLNKNDGRMRKLLDEFFRTRSVNGRAPAPVLTQSVVFKGFLQLCEDEGIKLDEYPLKRKRKGEWAITNYWKLWCASNARRAANNQYGADAAKEQDVDMAAANCTDLPPLPRPDGYARAELDEHLLHAVGLLTVPCRSGADIVVGTRRLWGLILRETGAGAILSTGVSYREKYDKNDVLRLVRKALKAPKRLENSSLPGLRYLPGAAYPSEDGFEMRRWQVTAFDADVSHLSIAEMEDLRKLLGEVENERVGQPTNHAHAESINARVATLMEGLPSGTGSSPQDPARRDPEAAAEQYSVNVVLLEEILDVWARNFNVTPQKSLDGRTPLQQLKVMEVQGRVFVSSANAFGDFELYKLLPRFEANITFSRSTPKRVGALGVNLHGAWYTSQALAKHSTLRAESDLRCTVYVEDDARYGWVVPHARPELKFFVKVTNRDLKDFPHSIEWRRLTEAHGTNAVYAAMPATASTMFQTLEGLANRAKAGEPGAAAAVSQFAGFMAQVQNGLLHYASSPEERALLDAEGRSRGGADAGAQKGADEENVAEAMEQGAEPPSVSEQGATKPARGSLPLQGQTPHQPLPSQRNPFGLKR